jgi:hypothetical protein
VLPSWKLGPQPGKRNCCGDCCRLLSEENQWLAVGATMRTGCAEIAANYDGINGKKSFENIKNDYRRRVMRRFVLISATSGIRLIHSVKSFFNTSWRFGANMVFLFIQSDSEKSWINKNKNSG